MKKTLLTLSSFLLLTLAVSAQSSPLQIEEKKVPGGVAFYGHSTSDQAMTITFALEKTRNIKGYKKPIKKTIPANKSVLLLKISTSPGYKYEYVIGIAKKPGGSSTLATKANSSSLDPAKLEKGIIMFDNSTCARCTYVGNYMVKNKIPFTVLDINDDENNALMQQLLQDQGHTSRRLQTPVMLVDGVISHSHKNLDKFLWKLSR